MNRLLAMVNFGTLSRPTSRLTSRLTKFYLSPIYFDRKVEYCGKNIRWVRLQKSIKKDSRKRERSPEERDRESRAERERERNRHKKHKSSRKPSRRSDNNGSSRSGRGIEDYHSDNPEPTVRRVALVAFNSAVHNKTSLVRDLLPELFPWLYSETKVKKELIREVEMGPFKHIVDDGTMMLHVFFTNLLNI